MGGLLLFLVLLTTAVITWMTRHDQHMRDRQRKTYVLHNLNSLDAEAVMGWLRSISGQRSRSTISFEFWATPNGFEYRLKVPWQIADFIMGQVQTLLPSVRYEEELDPPRKAWTKSVELRMSKPGRSLSIYEQMTTALHGSGRGINAGESVMMQIVVSPAKRARPPEASSPTDIFTPKAIYSVSKASSDEIKDRRAKLEQPCFQAVVRVAAMASTPTRAEHLINGVRNILRVAESHATRFERRLFTQAKLQQRLDHPATPMLYPMLLNVPELQALIAWPVGNPMISGLPPTMSPVLPAPESVLREGLILGNSTQQGRERPIAVGWEQALMHTWVGGVTGVGKSVLLAHAARQAMEAGHGVIMIEVEGNLYQSILDYVPKERIGDVVLLDVSDYQHPVGFNLLDQGHPMAVIDELMLLFKHRYQTSMWAEEYLYHGLRTLADTPGLSFTDLSVLLAPRTPEEQAWAKSIKGTVKDKNIREWWDRNDARDDKDLRQRVDPVLSRIWQLTSRPELRYVLGQPSSSFKLDEILRDNKILLVNFKGVSKDTASLAGTLLMNQIWHAVKSTPKDRPSFIILDEFADIADLPIDTESMLAQARKHNVGMVLANQNLGQLDKQMSEAIMANARNKVVLQVNAKDAGALVREFGKQVQPEYLTHLQAYEAIAQVQTPTGISSPMTISTIAPIQQTGNMWEVVRQSRERYGRNLSEVVSEMEARHTVKPSGPRPPIGSA